MGLLYIIDAPSLTFDIKLHLLSSSLMAPILPSIMSEGATIWLPSETGINGAIIFTICHRMKMSELMQHIIFYCNVGYMATGVVALMYSVYP